MTNTFPHENAEQRAATSSVGELLSGVTHDISTLMRQEVALAKAELTESAKKAGKGAGLYGGAGVAGHFALLFLSIAVWWGLGGAIESLAWSAVIVAVVYGIVAALLFVKGKKQIDSIQGMPQTADSVKRIPEALKPE